MTIKTLMHIYKVLDADLYRKEEFKKYTREELVKFEEEHELSWARREKVDVAEDIRDEYIDLIENHKIAYEEYSDARSAFDDFTSHEFS